MPGKRSTPEVPKEDPTGADSKVVASNRRNHRSAYPTPGFKAFAALLNLLAIPLGSLQLSANSSLPVLMLCLLALVGSAIAIYANLMRPLPTNIKLRKQLTAFSAGLGLFTLVALGLTFLFFS